MYGFFITKNVRNLSMSLKVDFVKKWIKIFSILSVWKLDQIEAQEVVIISQKSDETYFGSIIECVKSFYSILLWQWEQKRENSFQKHGK